MSFSTRVSTVTRQSTPRTALTPRALPLRPPHALRWISSSRSSLPLSAAFAAAFPSKALRAQTPPGTKPAAQADKETTGPPAFLPLKDLTPFTHPSLFHTPRWRFEIPEQVDGVPYTHYDYEMHVRYGEKILEMALLGLIWKTYPRLSAGGATDLLNAVLAPSILCDISQHYSLASTQLLGDPVALPALRKHPRTQANLLLAYIAGLEQEYGLTRTRQWIPRAFRAVLASEYEKLKEQREIRSRPTVDPQETATARLREWADKERIDVVTHFESEGAPPNETFTCRLSFSGEEFEGKGLSKTTARSSAATLALTHIDNLKSASEISAERTGSAESAIYNPHSWKLNEYCTTRSIEPEVSYRTDETEPDYQYCTLRVKGLEEAVTARGRGKPWAKDEASKIALQRLGVDISSLPAPSARGTHTSAFVLYCQRQKLGRTFNIRPDASGGPEWFLCRIEWGSGTVPRRWVEERGRGKAEAKNNACKSALELIGVQQ